jgi:hypothetical protein
MFLGQPARYALARQSFAEALSIARESGDERTTIDVLLFQGWLDTSTDDHAAAQALLAEALSRAQHARDAFSIGHAQWFLGELAFRQNEVETAQALFAEGAATLRSLRARNFLGGPMLRLGQVALLRGDYAHSSTCIAESLTLLNETGDVRGVALCLAACAALRAAEGRTVDAARFCGALDALLESLHTGLLPLDHTLYQRTLAGLRGQLTADAFDAAWTAGHALQLEQAIAFARTDVLPG